MCEGKKFEKKNKMIQKYYLHLKEERVAKYSIWTFVDVSSIFSCHSQNGVVSYYYCLSKCLCIAYISLVLLTRQFIFKNLLTNIQTKPFVFGNHFACKQQRKGGKKQHLKTIQFDWECYRKWDFSDPRIYIFQYIWIESIVVSIMVSSYSHSIHCRIRCHGTDSLSWELVRQLSLRLALAQADLVCW